MEQVSGTTFGCAIRISDKSRMVIECTCLGDMYDLTVSTELAEGYDHVPDWAYDGHAVTLMDSSNKQLLKGSLNKGKVSAYVAGRPHAVHFRRLHADLVYPVGAA
jgi:hypothetical protein